MKPLRGDKAVVLSAEAAGLIRQALVAASGIFGLAGQAGGPALALLREAALETVADGRPLNQVHYDVCLAIDCIDFAEPAGRDR